MHCNVTEHPTAEWKAEQLVRAFPWHTAPRYLLRDRDRIYGEALRIEAANMEIGEGLTAPQKVKSANGSHDIGATFRLHVTHRAGDFTLDSINIQ